MPLAQGHGGEDLWQRCKAFYDRRAIPLPPRHGVLFSKHNPADKKKTLKRHRAELIKEGNHNEIFRGSSCLNYSFAEDTGFYQKAAAPFLALCNDEDNKQKNPRQLRAVQLSGLRAAHEPISIFLGCGCENLSDKLMKAFKMTVWHFPGAFFGKEAPGSVHFESHLSPTFTPPPPFNVDI